MKKKDNFYTVIPFAIFLGLATSHIFANKIDDIDLDKTDLLIGNFDVKNHRDFSLLPNHVSLKKTYLRKETLQAFLQMEQAAQREGISLKVISGFRSYQHQKRIWNGKFKSYSPSHPNTATRVEEILKYSAIPGISRHHWGTDLDINALNNDYFLGKRGSDVHQWLKDNAEKYGFYLTYTFGRSGGYQPEMWHYTYYPSSSKITKEFYLYMTPEILPDFKGAESIDLEKVFYEYSFNINPIIIDKLRVDDISIILSY